MKSRDFSRLRKRPLDVHSLSMMVKNCLKVNWRATQSNIIKVPTIKSNGGMRGFNLLYKRVQSECEIKRTQRISLFHSTTAEDHPVDKMEQRLGAITGLNPCGERWKAVTELQKYGLTIDRIVGVGEVQLKYTMLIRRNVRLLH